MELVAQACQGRGPARHRADHRRVRRAQRVTVDDALAAAEGSARHRLRQLASAAWPASRSRASGCCGASPPRPAAGPSSRRPRTSSRLVHDTLADDVQNRYCSPTRRATSRWTARGVRSRCACRMPDYHVRARPGYFAPKPAPIRPTLEFTASGPVGRYLDVAADDLEVVENGVPQQMETFQEASQPVSIVLALDASGSMKKREADVIASARAFVSALRPEDELARGDVLRQSAFAHDLSHRSGRQPRRRSTATGRRRHGALRRRLRVAARACATPRAGACVVVMTDGRDENNAGTGPGSSTDADRRLEGSEGEWHDGIHDWHWHEARHLVAPAVGHAIGRPRAVSAGRE